MIERRSFITGLIALVAGSFGKSEPLVAYVAPHDVILIAWCRHPKNPKFTHWHSNTVEYAALQQKTPYILVGDDWIECLPMHSQNK